MNNILFFPHWFTLLFFLFLTAALANPHLIWEIDCGVKVLSTHESLGIKPVKIHIRPSKRWPITLVVKCFQHWMGLLWLSRRRHFECSADEPFQAWPTLTENHFVEVASTILTMLKNCPNNSRLTSAEATARLVWLGKGTTGTRSISTDGAGHCLQQQDNWPNGPGGAYGFGLYGEVDPASVPQFLEPAQHRWNGDVPNQCCWHQSTIRRLLFILFFSRENGLLAKQHSTTSVF